MVVLLTIYFSLRMFLLEHEFLRTRINPRIIQVGRWSPCPVLQHPKYIPHGGRGAEATVLLGGCRHLVRCVSSNLFRLRKYYQTAINVNRKDIAC